MQPMNKIFRCPTPVVEMWWPYFEAAMNHYKIDNPKRRAMFLTQIAHESDDLRTLSENLNYKAEALVILFGRHRITSAQAEQFGRTAHHPADQEALANILYGGEWGRVNLGNTEPGDGYKFRGQGPKQITGRANARAARDRLRVALGARVPDFEQSPELFCTPEWGAWSAGDFWNSRNLNAHADRGDVEAVTRAINGGLNGLSDRKARYLGALA